MVPDFPQDQLGTCWVLDVRSVYHYHQDQAQGVDEEMSLSSGDSLSCVVSTSAPFSVVLADWLSMMAALGSGSRLDATAARFAM
jgi:hypothetical protein